MMRIVLAIVVYLFSTAEISAQERYFLCIQSEDRQPFYVRVANKTWSSSGVGNVVVHSLGDSTYQVSVGFPRNKYPEQKYLVSFNRNDLGFTLKQSGDQGWSLLSWTTGEKISARIDETNEAIWYGERKKDDAFTNLMAAVVNDSAVLYVASVKSLPSTQEVFAKTQPAVTDTIKINVDTAGAAIVASPGIIIDTVNSVAANTTKIDTAIAVTDTVQAAIAVINPPARVADTLVVKADSTLSSLTIPESQKDTGAGTAGPILVYTAPKPTVSILNDIATGKGRTLTYADSSASGVDTISVVIDLDPDTINNLVAQQPVVEKVVAKVDSPKTVIAVDTPKTATTQVVADTPKIAGLPPAALVQSPAEEKKEVTAEPEKKKIVLINSDCANFASDNDIDKLRVKLLDESTIEGKLAATRKLFKSKCIYTRQIRALSELFPNDEAQFRFFEQCYPFTADTSEFRSLLPLLSEDAYIARFKTLVRIKD